MEAKAEVTLGAALPQLALQMHTASKVFSNKNLIHGVLSDGNQWFFVLL